jgi:hypothetical protein
MSSGRGKVMRLSQTPPERARQCRGARSAGSEQRPAVYRLWSIVSQNVSEDRHMRYIISLYFNIKYFLKVQQQVFVKVIMWRFIAVFSKAHHIQGGRFGRRKRPAYVAPNSLKRAATDRRQRVVQGRKATTPDCKAYSSMGETIYVYKTMV